MNKTIAPFAALLLTLSQAAPALAQKANEHDRMHERWAKSQGGRFSFEVDVLSSSYELQTQTGPVESSRLGVGVAAVSQFKIFAGLYLDAEMTIGYGDVSGPQSTDILGETLAGDGKHNGFVLGTPLIGLHYAGNVLPSLALFGGLSAGIPIVHDPSQGLALTAASIFPARAYADAHRMLWEHVPIRAKVGTEVRLSILQLRSDIAALIAVPTRDGSTTKLVLETGNEIEVRAPGGFGGGIRLQMAMPTSSSDGAQLAAEPFVGWEPSVKGSFGRVGFLVALDENLGFGLDPGKVATIRVALGSKW